MMASGSAAGTAPSQRITDLIDALGGWRGDMLAQLRELILEADPGATEEWKWNTPVWSHNGLVCAVAAFKDHMKLNFFQGAALEDPDGLFNAGHDAKATRAIDLLEGDAVDRDALKRLVAEAVAHNTAGAK
jgi:hypothetical protein